MTWSVVCELQPDMLAGGQNRTALLVMLCDGATRCECSRVGFVRRNTKNKDVAFADQLQIEMDKAHEVAATINELEEYLEELRQEAAEHTRKRIEWIMGKQSSVPV